INRNIIGHRHNLPANVLQRSHPVPVSHQTFEAEANPSRGFAAQIEFLFFYRWIDRGTICIDGSRHQEHGGEPEDDDAHEHKISNSLSIAVAQGHDVYLKLRRLKMSVAAASTTET